MSVHFDLLRIEGLTVALAPAERARYSLGPIGSDPRDSVAWVQVLDVDSGGGGSGIGDPFFYPFERAATTPSGLLALLRPIAEATATAAEDANTYRELIGRRFRV